MGVLTWLFKAVAVLVLASLSLVLLVLVVPTALVAFLVALPVLILLVLCRGLMALLGWRSPVHVGRVRGRREQLSQEENRITQELWRGLEKLNERVEALETILLDRANR